MSFKVCLLLCLVQLNFLYPQEENMITRYFNGRVLRDHKLQEIDLWVNQGKIISPQSKADCEIDLKGLIVAPGYIDIQINGAFGYDFTTQPEKVEIVASLLTKYGVTAFLPTVISSTSDQYNRILPYLQPKTIKGSATLLGIHLEGPFFNKKRYGAHHLDAIQAFNQTTLEECYGSLEGVRIVTLAPELPYALEAIQRLKELGIVVSAGHTSASYQEIQEGIRSGISLATHLFNAMEPLHHREPGVIGAVLTTPDLHFSVIADGVHLHPAILKLIWLSNPQGLILVTDAMEALGLEEGVYYLGSKEVFVKDGKAVLSGTEIIAGSVISMDAAVRYLHKQQDALSPKPLKPLL